MNNMKSSDMVFSIQTMQTSVGGSLKRIDPDSSGTYRDVPVAVIGKPSRNGSLYTPGSFINAMVNPNTRFHKSLAGGGLEGEWGHPNTIGMSSPDAVARTMRILEDRVSHYFTKIKSKEIGGGVYLVFADVVPFGPYGKFLKDAFADEKRNACFSLRSITGKPRVQQGGILEKDVIAMITFDSVSTPGFEEASKRFMNVGNEQLEYDIVEEAGFLASAENLIQTVDTCEVVGVETLTNQKLLDLLEVDSVTIKTSTTNVELTRGLDGSLITPAGKKASPFHTLF